MSMTSISRYVGALALALSSLSAGPVMAGYQVQIPLSAAGGADPGSAAGAYLIFDMAGGGDINSIRYVGFEATCPAGGTGVGVTITGDSSSWTVLTSAEPYYGAGYFDFGANTELRQSAIACVPASASDAAAMPVSAGSQLAYSWVSGTHTGDFGALPVAGGGVYPAVLDTGSADIAAIRIRANNQIISLLRATAQVYVQLTATSGDWQLTTTWMAKDVTNSGLAGYSGLYTTATTAGYGNIRSAISYTGDVSCVDVVNDLTVVANDPACASGPPPGI